MLSLRHPLTVLAFPALLSLAASCGGDDTTSASGGASSSSTATGAGGGATSVASTSTGAGGGSCSRTLGPADADRFVVVGHGFDAQGNKGTDYEVLGLSAQGVLAKLGTHFSMGVPTDRTIVFTPDAKLGFAVQDDGSIGVFRLHTDGSVEVLEAKHAGAYYADRLVMSAAGDHLYVVDPDFQASGGGVYRIDIGCDDSLKDVGLVVATKSASDLAFLSGDEAVLAAKEVPGAATGDTVARIDLGAVTPTAKGSALPFSDADAVVSGVALTHDARFLLIGDNSAFSATPNSVAFVPVTTSGLGAAAKVADLQDPFALATSPFDDAALVVSGFGDALFVLAYQPTQAAPFSVVGELTYKTTGPQVPGALAMVSRGALAGRVLVADVRGVYQAAFQGQGVVTDLDIFDLGGGTENDVSSIGVTP